MKLKGTEFYEIEKEIKIVHFFNYLFFILKYLCRSECQEFDQHEIL